MGKKTPAAPTPPDPVATAAAQSATNISTAQANAALGNVNQVTPDGSLTYSQSGSKFITDNTAGQTYWRGPNGEIQSSRPTVPGSPAASSSGGFNPRIVTGQVTRGRGDREGYAVAQPQYADGWSEVKGYYMPTYTATTTLSPQQQAIKDQTDAASLNLGTIANKQTAFLDSYLSRPVDTSGLPAAGNASSITAPQYERLSQQDYEASRQRVEEAMYSRLNPQIARDRASMEAQLANQGIRLGSTAWSSAMDDFNRGIADQRTSITLAGGEEQSRLAGLDFQRTGFNNSVSSQERAAQIEKFNAENLARSNAMQEQFAYRNQPLNEISALMSGSQISSPNFVNTNMPTVPTVDYAGLVQDNYKSQLANWQQQQASKPNVLGGLFGLGAAALGNPAFKFSDRRLKTDIEIVGAGPLRLPVYAFRYIGDTARRLGFMAQDVARVLPAAVLRVGTFLAVDYAKVQEAR